MTMTIDQPQQLLANLDPLLSMKELAEYTKTSMSTLYSIRSAGKGPRGFRLGRALRFRLSDVDGWITEMAANDGADR